MVYSYNIWVIPPTNPNSSWLLWATPHWLWKGGRKGKKSDMVNELNSLRENHPEYEFTLEQDKGCGFIKLDY